MPNSLGRPARKVDVIADVGVPLPEPDDTDLSAPDRAITDVIAAGIITWLNWYGNRESPSSASFAPPLWFHQQNITARWNKACPDARPRRCGANEHLALAYGSMYLHVEGEQVTRVRDPTLQRPDRSDATPPTCNGAWRGVPVSIHAEILEQRDVILRRQVPVGTNNDRRPSE